MKIRHISFVSIFACVVSTQASPLPAPVSSMLQRQKSVITSAELNTEEREFLWRDTKTDRRGYIRTEGSVAYVNIINSFTSHPLFKRLNPPRTFATVNNGSLALDGILEEDKFRTTYVFSLGQQRIAITLFKFKAAGARPVVAEEFLTQKVNGAPATLALAVAKGTGDGMWKVGWMRPDRDYEVWIPDKLDSNEDPTLSASIVLDICESLADILENER